MSNATFSSATPVVGAAIASAKAPARRPLSVAVWKSQPVVVKPVEAAARKLDFGSWSVRYGLEKLGLRQDRPLQDNSGKVRSIRRAVNSGAKAEAIELRLTKLGVSPALATRFAASAHMEAAAKNLGVSVVAIEKVVNAHVVKPAVDPALKGAAWLAADDAARRAHMAEARRFFAATRQPGELVANLRAQGFDAARATKIATTLRPPMRQLVNTPAPAALARVVEQGPLAALVAVASNGYQLARGRMGCKQFAGLTLADTVAYSAIGAATTAFAAALAGTGLAALGLGLVASLPLGLAYDRLVRKPLAASLAAH